MAKTKQSFVILLTTNLLIQILVIISIIMHSYRFYIILIFISIILSGLFFLHNIRQYCLFGIFYVCLITFLLGGEAAALMQGNVVYKHNYDIYTQSLLLVMLSIGGLTLGWFIEAIYRLLKKKEVRTTNMNYEHLQRWSWFIFLITSIAPMIKNLIKAQYAIMYGYSSLYVGYSKVPAIFERLSIINACAIWFYLYTKPSERKAKTALLIYFIINSISIFSGVRTTLIITILSIIFYISWRYSDERRKINRNVIIGIIIVAPMLLAAMSQIRFIRDGENISISFIESIILFFNGKTDIIQDSIFHLEELRDIGRHYTVGPIKYVLEHNFLSQILFDIKHIAQNSLQAALSGHSLGFTVSYLEIPKYYFSGNALGSSYIAELFVDFGAAGVYVGSVLVGYFIAAFARIIKKNPCIFVIGMLLFDNICTMSRSSLLSGIGELLSPTYIISFILFYMLIRIKALNINIKRIVHDKHYYNQLSVWR